MITDRHKFETYYNIYRLYNTHNTLYTIYIQFNVVSQQLHSGAIPTKALTQVEDRRPVAPAVQGASRRRAQPELSTSCQIFWGLNMG